MKYDIIFILIIIHAALGGIALISGFISALSFKGGPTHRRSGQIFFYGGTISIVLSLIITMIPGHWNPFLLSIGLFSLYFLVIGFRSVRYKTPGYSAGPDIILTWAMLICCLLMIVLPVWLNHVINIVTAAFGLLGVVLCYGNFRYFYHKGPFGPHWKRFHIIHMSAALISLSSAFLVVNHVLPSLFNWFLPTVIGTFFIVFSLRKYTRPLFGVRTEQKVFLWLLLFSPSLLLSQSETERTYSGRFTVRVGLSRAVVQDARLSGRSHRAWYPRYGISHFDMKENSQSTLHIDLAFFTGSRSDKIFRMKTVHTDVVYSYRRRLGNGFWVGGYMNTFTLFNYPVSAVPSFFTNNPISYHLSQSVGPSVSWSPVRSDGLYPVLASSDIALLSYVIQPVYGHPYPAKYLKEGVFDPNRSRMAGPFMKSGKIMAFKRFMHMNIQLGWFFLVNNRYTFGLDYRLGTFAANSRGKPVSFRHNDLFITTGIFY